MSKIYLMMCRSRAIMSYGTAGWAQKPLEPFRQRHPQNLLRIAVTAKAWGARPSSYATRAINSAEAFMFDEACAYVMGVEQQRILRMKRKGRS